jgi:hypothetical protein
VHSLFLGTRPPMLNQSYTRRDRWVGQNCTPALNHAFRKKSAPHRTANYQCWHADSAQEAAIQGSKVRFRLTMLQCDQTIAGTNSRMMCREEVGQSLQGRVSFFLRVRLQHGNNCDCSIGAFSTRGRGLGIFALAALTRLPDKYPHALPDLVCGMPDGRSAPSSIR